MRTRLVFPTLFVLLLCACKSNDANMEDLNNVDRGFVINASVMNKQEIDLGQMAASGATNTGVRDFGQLMVTEHGASRTQLRTIASGLLLAAPDSIDAAHIALKNQLMGMSGRPFDSVYINSQVADHLFYISIYQNEITNGAASDLIAFARDQLAKLQAHWRVADSLARHL